ncbi:tripartite tricarboxylate transporter TctB family protein [Hydrogenophaga palleronii]|nr:tripartite tricarboxylate transporter TctB family protein [Hydrogenophaga palleronii]
MSEGGKSARSDLWGGAGWTAFGLLILAESFRMDRFTSMGAQLYTMPGFVPGMLGGVVVLLGLVLMLRGWRRSAAGAQEAPGEPLLNRRIGIMLALSLPYAALLIGRVPFWLATALFVTAFVVIFAPPEASPTRRWLVALAVGLLGSAIVTVMFQEVFLVRLP